MLNGAITLENKMVVSSCFPHDSTRKWTNTDISLHTVMQSNFIHHCQMEEKTQTPSTGKWMQQI